MATTYSDRRAAFWSAALDKASDYETYLSASPREHADRWRTLAGKLPALTEEQRGRLAGYNRTLHVLVSSGVWCGDCVRQVPMVKQIADAADPGVTLRILDRDADEALREELTLVGADRVPVAVFLTEDFWEVGRFGDRSLTAYRAKAQRETGAACALGHVPPPADELAAEQAEWVDLFERMLLMVRLSPALRQRHGD